MFEYLGEQIDPKEVGDVDVNGQYEVQKRPAIVIFKFAVVVVLLAAAVWALSLVLPHASWQAPVLAVGLVLIYVGVAFFVRPKANMENMGWGGGLIDDPFHYSDDMNRGLHSLHFVLLPGRFVAGTLIDMLALCGWHIDDQSPSQTTQPVAEQAEEVPAGEGRIDLSSAKYLEQQ